MSALWNAYKRVVETIAVLAILVVLVVGMLQVALRYGTDQSLIWSEELLRYTMLWLVMLCSGLAYSQGQFMGMRVLVESLPPALTRACDIVSALLMLVFLAVIGWYGAQFAFKTRLQIAPTLNVSLLWIHGAIVAGALLMALHVFLDEVLNNKVHRPKVEIME